MLPTEVRKKDDKNEHEIDLVHCTQKTSWDCGLACTMMVLPKSKRDYFNQNFDQICEEEGFGTSTWTIDLCYVLKKFSVNFIYYTTMLGVNPHHKSQFFYEKIFHKDKERIIKKFKDAKKNGIVIEEKSVKVSELIQHVRKHGPIIVLTNAGYLTCEICNRNVTTSKLIDYLPKSVTFHGHYVVLCGYNLKQQQLYYRNPAYSSRTCAMNIQAMNKARKCSGTDEDCIFIFKSNVEIAVKR